MLRKRFNKGWTIVPATGLAALMGGPQGEKKEVTLPYDLMLDEPRSAESPNGGANGFYPSLAILVI